MKVIDKIKRSTKAKLIINFYFIVLIIITSIGIAYAKYVTTIHGRAEAKIASWSFKVNGQSNENFTINLADTRIENQQQANVEDGFVGPGTSGVFKIVIDGTGSEVSLEYDINMDIDVQNNEKFPKNLIFYSDAEMKNAIYHGDNSINLNGYILQSDTNKVSEKIIYWKWDYETGQTEDEKNANDISDSEWMGKYVSLNINVAGRQVEETLNNNQCEVIFDANGGVLQEYGNATRTIKKVDYGEQYGNLPVPVREGYVFNGWNTKNLIDEESLLMAIDGAEYRDGYYVFTFGNVHKAYGGQRSIPFNFEKNKQYTITISGYVDDDMETKYAGLICGYIYEGDGGTKYSNNFIDSNKKTIKYTTEENKTLATMKWTYGTGTNRYAYISHFKIEEGTVSSLPIEPNQIVDFNGNKIVYAEWIKK